MRREIDKAREETDLINQLRNVSEFFLKLFLNKEFILILDHRNETEDGVTRRSCSSINRWCCIMSFSESYQAKICCKYTRPFTRCCKSFKDNVLL